MIYIFIKDVLIIMKHVNLSSTSPCSAVRKHTQDGDILPVWMDVTTGVMVR